MTNYVAGFAFNESLSEVLLVRKNKPEWQAGRLNGIGGKIEPSEAPGTAMIREFHEETGIRTNQGEWQKFAYLVGSDVTRGADSFQVDFYWMILTDDRFLSARTVESEEILAVPLGVIWSKSKPMIDNVRMLVALALDDSGLDRPVKLSETF